MVQHTLRRVFSRLLLPLVVLGLLQLGIQPAQAASGGRIGGGSFRSSPSLPRSYGGGTRGGYGGGYGGGGFGFPFFVPIFGFGGGLFGFLVLMAVAGILINALRGGAGAALAAGGEDEEDGAGRASGPVSIAQVQIGLLASARAVQEDLRRLADRADTASSSGLQQVLQETSLSLLRQPDLWVYASAEVGEVPFPAAEATFNRLSMRERSKLRREITSNVGGRRLSDGASSSSGPSDASSEYIAITLLVASRRRLPLPGAASADALRDSLQRLGAVGAEDLIALEVIWQPEGAGEVLSSEELITAYPDLQHL